jgi:hypothetical protein
MDDSTAQRSHRSVRGGNTRAVWLALVFSSAVSGCSTQATAQPATTQGPHYVVSMGEGTPVCEAFQTIKTKTVLVNGVPDVPEFGRPRYGDDYDGPEWALLRKVRDFLWVRDVNPVNHLPSTEAAQWRGTPEQLESARRNFFVQFERDVSSPLGYRIGQFDIDNDGVSDRIFYRSGPGSTLLVLNGDETDVDVERTERILKHPSRHDAGWPEVRPPWPNERARSEQAIYPVTDAYTSAEYGVFIFEGNTYVDLWWSQHPEYSGADRWTVGAAHVYLTEGTVSREVCVMRLAYE